MTFNPDDKLKQLHKQAANLPGLAGSVTPMLPRLPLDSMIERANANHADEFHKRLVSMINDFDKSLDDNHEVGVRLVTFGQNVTFHLTSLGYWNPSLITFAGIASDGNPVELIQHVSQISILLMKVPRLEPNKPKKPIGFHSNATDSGEEVES